jgi:hypothetical protein
MPGLALGGLAAAVAWQVAESPVLAGASGGLILLAYLPVLLYVALGVWLAPKAVAVEGLSATEALSRSWELVRGHRWTLFLFELVMLLVIWIPGCCCCICLLSLPRTFVEVARLDGDLRLVHPGEPWEWRAAPRPPANTPGA